MEKRNSMSKIFLDAAYAIALSAPSDQYHDLAVTYAEQIELEGTPLITTRAIMLEIGNALAKLRYRNAAIELLDSLEDDPTIEIIPISEELYNHAFQLYRNRQDKEWGLTDCISFVVMKNQKIIDALTTDEHFIQAGFNALLL
jgi:uncharacterized protein